MCVLVIIWCFSCLESKISNLSACPMCPSSPDAVMASSLSSGKPGKTIYWGQISDHCQNYLKLIRGANFFFHRGVRSQYLVLGGKTVLWSISLKKRYDSGLFSCWRSWNRTKVFPMQEFQQHHSNNQMQGQRGSIQIFFLALKKWWAMMLCSMLEGTDRRSAARLHPGQLDRRRQFRLNHSSGFQFCAKGHHLHQKSHMRL